MNRVYYSIRNIQFNSAINRARFNKSNKTYQNTYRKFSMNTNNTNNNNNYSKPPPRYPWEYLIIPATVIGINHIYLYREDCWK